MALKGAELEKQLKEAGNRLLDPPPSVDELLDWLDELRLLLVNVGQEPSTTMQDALLPPMKALISSELLRHSDSKVKISVACCLCEITRITAPDAPYDDDQMKEIFELTVAAIGKLSNATSESYHKAVSILESVAKIRSCLVMLDLELDDLVLDMFRQFIKIMRSNHQPNVYAAMETIMTMVIHESEEISLDLITLLLSTVRKELQRQSPMAWKLGTEVLTKCADTIAPYLKEAVQSGQIALDEYGPKVISICQEECHGSGKIAVTEEPDVLPAESDTAFIKNAEGNGCPQRALSSSIKQHSRSDHGQSSTEIGIKLEAESDTETDSKKIGWKLMNPDEGNDHSSIEAGQKLGKQPHGHISLKKRTDDLSGASPLMVKRTPPGDIASSTSRQKKKESDQDVDPSSLPSKRVMAGAHAVHRSGDSNSSNVKLKSRDKSKLELEQKKPLRKNGIVLHNEDRVSASPELHEKAEHQGDSKETLPNKSAKVVPKKKDRSSVQTGYKSSAMITNAEEHATEASNEKETKSLKRSRIDNVETPKVAKKKRTLRKEVASDTPNHGEDLIGCRIKVWWPMDKTFYEGIVASFDPVKKKHLVLYEDGDEEILNLKRQRWELIGKLNPLDEGHDTILPKMKESCDVPQKGRRKSTLRSPGHGKPGLSSRRGGADNISRARLGCGRKSADGRHSRHIIVEEDIMDDVSGPVAGPKAADERSRVKLRVKSSSAAGMNEADGVESGREVPESGSASETGNVGDELSSSDSRSAGEYYLN